MSEQYSSAALKINGGDLATTRHDLVARLKKGGRTFDFGLGRRAVCVYREQQ